MACNDGLHKALYRDYRGEWFCLACGEPIDEKEVRAKRKEARSKKKLPAPPVKLVKGEGS